MGLEGGTKTKTGAWSTGADVLEDLALKGVPLARTIVDWRQLNKLRSTYTDALPAYINERTGRVHTTYSQHSVLTGRLSSNDPNLQNIPVRTEDGRKIRSAFVAAPGKILVSADYSQIELRVLAHIADIQALKDAFEEGLDIHAMTNAKSHNPSERAFVERASINAPIQGSAADIIRRAMIRMEPELNKARIDADMLLQVHDELIFEVPLGTESAAIPVIKRVMEGAAEPAVRLTVPIQVDANAAGNWDEAH